MARIAGIDIPRDKRLEVSLTYIYGIGRITAIRICEDNGLDLNARVSSLTEDEVNKIRSWVDANLTIEGDLRRDVQNDIKRKICLLYTSPSPRDRQKSRMPSSA